MDHAVSTTGGKVPAEEKLRLENVHGKARAAEIVAEVEAMFALPAGRNATKKSNQDAAGEAAASVDNGDA